jgi:hypothetical protein
MSWWFMVPGWNDPPGGEAHPGPLQLLRVSGNFRSLLLVREQARRSWYKWLCRRSQPKRLTWERFADLLRDFPLPWPRITVRFWDP